MALSEGRLRKAVVLVLAGLALAACRSSATPSAAPADQSPSTTSASSTTSSSDVPTTSSSVVTTTTSTTEGIIVNPPTTIVTYPTPYAPSYDTVAALVDDSTYIVIATLQPEEEAIGGYPLDVQQTLGFNYPMRELLSITTTEFDAANLTVGDTYVFFHADDPVDGSTCIVGGVKGVFAYDPNSQTVTRLDQSTTSQIPMTQSLSDLQDSITAEENVEASEPDSNLPPVCSSSATGL